MVRLVRSPRVSPSIQNESEGFQKQLSLFASSSNNETKDTAGTVDAANTEMPSEGAMKSTARSTKKNVAYSAADIQVLEGIAAIRHRPGMYIGSTSPSGLLHLIWEALVNCIIECLPDEMQQTRW